MRYSGKRTTGKYKSVKPVSHKSGSSAFSFKRVAASHVSSKGNSRNTRLEERTASGRLFFWMGATSVLLMAILFISAKRLSGSTPTAAAPPEPSSAISVLTENPESTTEIESASMLTSGHGAQYDRQSRMLVEALYINSDVQGYLTVEGSSVSCPVVQGNDNKFYLANSIHKKPAKTGSVFFDCRNRDIANDRNLVIYGNADKNGMFAELLNFTDIDFYEQHEYITLDRRFWTDGVTVWKIVAAYWSEEKADPLLFESPEGKRTLTMCAKSAEGDFIIKAEEAD